MIQAMREAAEAMLKMAGDQSNMIASELSTDYDLRNAAMTVFNDAMKAVASKRDEADRMQADAVRALNTALNGSGTVTLSILQQLGEGRMVTGTATPAPRKAKLAIAGGRAAE